jgi:hypothetical protein
MSLFTENVTEIHHRVDKNHACYYISRLSIMARYKYVYYYYYYFGAHRYSYIGSHARRERQINK